jgi:predicted RecA/RadA family phage recombinase
MATNRVYEHGNQLALPVPSGTKSGDLVAVGALVGVALIDRDDDDGLATVQLDGVFNLSVKGVDGAGNSAVAIGDALTYVSADTPKLSKKTTGVGRLTALATVASGATATIPVRLSN